MKTLRCVKTFGDFKYFLFLNNVIVQIVSLFGSSENTFEILAEV